MLVICTCAILGALAVFLFAANDPRSANVALFGLATTVCILLLLRGRIGKVLDSVRNMPWWHVLWLLAFLSGLVFRTRSGQDIQSNALDFWAAFRVGLMGVTGAVLLVRQLIGRTNWAESLRRGPLAALSVYCVVCLLSTTWSVFPGWTLYKSIEFFVDVALLGAIIASAPSIDDWIRLVNWTWTLIAALVASAWLGLAISPDQALVANEGLFGFQLECVLPGVDSNSLGELGAVLAVVSLCRLLFRPTDGHRRFWLGVLLAISVLTMVLAQARSAVLGCAVSVGLVLLLSNRVRFGAAFGLASAIALLIGTAWNTLIEFMRRGESDAELYNLSSRVDWWSSAWPAILEHPLTGYGAYAGARFLVMAELKIDTGIHSDWLEILTGTGILGLLPALLAFLGTWGQLLKSVRNRLLSAEERYLALEMAGVFAILTVRSVFSPVLYLHPPLVYLAAIGCSMFFRVRRTSASVSLSPALAGA